MIPIRDINPTRRTPIVTYILIGLNIVLFLYELSLGRGLDGFLNDWGLRSTDVMAFLSGNFSLLGTVFSKALLSMFLHGGWVHIGSNLLFLWIFGDNVEDNFGSARFLLFYLLCGFGASLAQALMTPNSPIPAIGASGAISGVLAAYLLLYPGASIKALMFIFIFFTVIQVPAWLIIILWFGLQLLNGFASLSAEATMAGGVAYGAHIGGFIVGLLLAFVFRRTQNPPQYVTSRRYF